MIPKVKEVDAPSVSVRPATSGQGSSASAMEHQTCWLIGTDMLMRDGAGTQIKSLWAYTSRCTGSNRKSAS